MKKLEHFSRGAFPTVVISPFFVALSASAIAYIRTLKHQVMGKSFIEG